MNSTEPTKPSKQGPTSNKGKGGRPPIEWLRGIFSERKERNPAYSHNAFARDLGLTASLLSRILNGSRELTLKQGMQITVALAFDPNETNQFILGILQNAKSTAKISKKLREQIEQKAHQTFKQVASKETPPVYVDHSIERFKAIARWYHLAILNLTYTDGFNPNPRFIAERLGITQIEAQDAIDRLIELGMLERDEDGSLHKSAVHFYFKTERSEVAIRQYQTSMIEKAVLEMNKTTQEDFSKRLINSITFACGAEHVQKLKAKIDEFQDEILASARNGPHHEVYQFNFQLFPLTKNSKFTKKEQIK